MCIRDRITSTDVEKGGALYLQYNGNKDTDQYAVRVSSGTRVPTLDLYQVKDKEERMKRIRTYIEELQDFVPVSYTHLDVYKRQEYRLPHIRKGIKLMP